MKDLRELMEWLEARGEVAHVSREVDPEYELVAVAKKINEATGKAVYFEHVKGSQSRTELRACKPRWNRQGTEHGACSDDAPMEPPGRAADAV